MQLESQPKQTLAELTDELVTYRDTLEGMDSDSPDAALIAAKIEQIESLHSNKVDRYCAFVRFLSAEQEQLKADKQRLERRQRSYKHLEESRRKQLAVAMHGNRVSQMKGRGSTVTLMPGQQRLEITDKSSIPNEYWYTVPTQIIEEHRECDLNAVEADLRRGIDVRGARLVDGEPFVRIS